MTEGPHQEQLRRLPQQARSRDLIGFWTRRLSYLLKLAMNLQQLMKSLSGRTPLLEDYIGFP